MRKSRFTFAAAIAAGALVLAGCGGGGGTTDPTNGGEQPQGGAGSVQVLIGASGDAELNAVKEAVAAWSAESGIEAEVIPASDLVQQLSQGFAGGNPPDLFYLSTDQLATYAANGSVMAYGDQLANKDAFYPNLVDAFSIDGTFYCAPKDFSTLALVINTKLWDAAGLTDADIPTTWEELADVSAKLTKDGVVGLAFGAEVQRLGVFMAEAGGEFVDDSGKAVVNSASNVEAFEYVKEQLAAGSFAYSVDLGAGWGGEAFGKEMAAMVIEGNWIQGALENDFPEVEYKVVELPAGPAGKGTLQYTNCWGIATDADNTEGAIKLVEYLTTPEQQMKFAKGFGVMPSVAAAADQWKTEFPELAAFIDGAEYAINLPAMAGSADVIADFNSQLLTLKTGNVQSILDSVNTSLQSILD